MTTASLGISIIQRRSAICPGVRACPSLSLLSIPCGLHHLTTSRRYSTCPSCAAENERRRAKAYARAQSTKRARAHSVQSNSKEQL